MKHQDFHLPECGMYFGSAVYVSFKDYTIGLGRMFTCWNPEGHIPNWFIDRTIEENQGNLVQLWPNSTNSQLQAAAWWRGLYKDGLAIPLPDWDQGRFIEPGNWPEIAKNDERYGEGMLDFFKEAAAKGLYAMCIYSDAKPRYSGQLAALGDRYLGDDCGECFTFRFDDTLTKTEPGRDRTLRQLADGFMATVRKHVNDRKAAGWGRQISTSGSYALDLEVIAGIELPLFEDFNENKASALCRGLTKQFDLPAWGSHLNHEWYCWLPYSSKCRFESFRNGLYQKYMSGAKVLVNECGNWYLQSNLCQDSPMLTDVPKIHNPGIRNDYKKSAPFVAEARRHYDAIGYDSPHARRYRKEMSDFYDFLKANGTPKGQPETRIALVKGNLDIAGHYAPNHAIASTYDMAEKNPNWFASTPELGWQIASKVFFPHNNVTGEFHNLHVSGTPYGPVDIITFSKTPSVDFLLEHYATLIFVGWNTCTEEQYGVIAEYVKRGGRVFISLAQLSTDDTRKIESFTVDDLIRKGDFAELCGCKVKGKGARFYWAVSESDRWNDAFEFPYLRRFGIMAKCLGDVEFTDDVEVMLCDDEDFRPLMFRHRFGKGEIYFLNAWCYPGAMGADIGPSAERDSPSLIGYVWKHLANRSRSTIWITDDGQVPRKECEYIMFSFFPEDGTVCLMNIDFDDAHAFKLHLPGEVRDVVLGPSEFQKFTFRKNGHDHTKQDR